MNGSLFSGFLFGRRGFLRREKQLSTSGAPGEQQTPAPSAGAIGGNGAASRDSDGEAGGGGGGGGLGGGGGGGQVKSDSQQQQQQHGGGLLVQMPKNVRYVVLRHPTKESPDEDEDNGSPSIHPLSSCSSLTPQLLRPQLRKTPATHHHYHASSFPTRTASEDASTHHSQSRHPLIASPSSSVPGRDPRGGGRRHPTSLVVPLDRPTALGSGGGGCGGSVDQQPCRIVVQTDDSPIEGGRAVDSRRNSSASMGESSGAGGPIPGGPHGGPHGDQRRGSISPKQERSGGGGGGGGMVSSFLWGLGGSSSNVPSPGIEDQFWVPDNILLKKRANSMVSPAFLGTNCSEFSESGRRLSASLDCSSTERLKTIGTTASMGPMGPMASPWAAAAAAAAEGQTLLTVASAAAAAATSQKLRRASMQSVLDHTKIDASMYERPPPLINQKPHSNVNEDNIGSIHFRLTFDPGASVLTVLLYQGVDLVPRQGPSPSSSSSRQLGVFARVRLLLPDHSGPTLTSQVHRRSLSPKFDEDFAFEVTRKELCKRTLEVAIIFESTEAPLQGEDEGEQCAGQVLLPLDQVDLSEPVYLWKGLSHFEGKAQLGAAAEILGELLLSVSYLSSAERLTFIITKARNLQHSDGHSAAKPVPNPFVRVTLFHGGRKLKRKRTTTKKGGGASPEWNEAVVFGLARDLFDSVQAEVAVLSETLIGTDEAIGRILFGSTVVQGSAEQLHWLTAIGGPRSGAPSAWFRMTPPPQPPTGE